MERVLNDAIFDFVFGEAMDDLDWRGASQKKGLKKAIEDDKSDESIRNIVKVYATNVINGEILDSQSTRKAISKVAGVSNMTKECGEDSLTFGNAQKLINMTMKYLYIQYYGVCRGNFKFCDCPMDSKLKEFLIKRIKEKRYEGLPELGKDWAWSKIRSDDISEYEAFQETVRHVIEIEGSGCLPIEFDFIAWEKEPNADLQYDIFVEETN